MIRRSDEIKTELREKMRGGDGTVKARALLNGADEMYGKGRLFSEMALAPGCSIGTHKHEGESETYFIVRGSGEYDDNGVLRSVSAGDVTFTGDGESHGIRNTGSGDLVFVALILYR